MFILFLFLFGLAVGSFLNVVIYRLDTKEGVVKSRSKCRNCGKILTWCELIPILSFIIQKRRCRKCKKLLSFQYPLVELFTGVIFALFAYYKLPFTIHYSLLATGYFFWFYYFAVLIIIFVYDYKYYIIPDKIIIPAILISFIVAVFTRLNFFKILAGKDLFIPANNSITELFFSILVGAGFFFFLILVSQGKWMGFGDVKLAVFMALILGWPNILAALFFSFISGSVVSLFLMAFKEKQMKDQIPFGPFLVLGTFGALFFGEKLINWYLQYIF